MANNCWNHVIIEGDIKQLKKILKGKKFKGTLIEG